MAAQLTELKVRDVAIKLHRAGRGPAVLFLNGAGGVPQWLPFFDALAERYELLVPEHPGFGGSDDPPWIHSMPDLAMFYLDIVEEAGLDRIHLIGNSLGGWLAAEDPHPQSLALPQPRPARAGWHPRQGSAVRRQLHLGPRGGGA
jgi:alpha-beta hydrolase superfamily lysophospholipase